MSNSNKFNQLRQEMSAIQLFGEGEHSVGHQDDRAVFVAHAHQFVGTVRASSRTAGWGPDIARQGRRRPIVISHSASTSSKANSSSPMSWISSPANACSISVRAAWAAGLSSIIRSSPLSLVKGALASSLEMLISVEVTVLLQSGLNLVGGGL